MRKAQQAVSSQSVKEVEEFAQFQEVGRGSLRGLWALLILACGSGARKGFGSRGETAACAARSGGRGKGLPRFPAAERRLGSGLRQVA